VYKRIIDFPAALEACRNTGARLATLKDSKTQRKVASKLLLVFTCFDN